MSVTSETNKVRYACDGVTVAFAVPYVFQNSTDLVVLKVDSSGGETTLTLNVDYTVTGGSGSTGTVTTTTAHGATYTLCIWRQVPKTQLLDIAEGGPFAAASIEAALDKQTQITQDIYARMLSLKRGGATSGPLEIPSLPTGDSVLGWDATSDGFEWVSQTTIVNAQFDSISNYASLSAAITSFGANQKTLLVDVNSTVAVNTSVPANVALMFINGAKLTVNTGITLSITGQIQAAANQQIFSLSGTGTVTIASGQWATPQWWGAKCDGVTSDSTAINNALASGAPIVMTKGTYLVNSHILVPSNTIWVGQGKSSIIKKGTSYSFAVSSNIGVIRNSDGTNGNTNIYLSNFAISHPVYNAANKTQGIGLYRVDTFIVEKIYTSSWLDMTPIDLNNGCRNGIVQDCIIVHENTVTGSGGAIQVRSGIVHDATGISDSYNVLIRGNYAESRRDETIAAFSVENSLSNIIIEGNNIRSGTGAATAFIAMSTGSDVGAADVTAKHIIISGNYISGRVNILPASEDIMIIGNKINMEADIDSAGINCTGNSGGFAALPKDILIAGNTIRGNARSGSVNHAISISGKASTGYFRIVNNVITNWKYHCIYAPNVSYVEIFGNYMESLSGGSHTINMPATNTFKTEYVNIENNIFSGGNQYCIAMVGTGNGYFSNLTIRNNVFRGFTVTAIQATIGSSATAYNLFVEGNKIVDSAGTGSGMNFATGPDYAGSTLINNKYIGSNTAFSLGATALAGFFMKDNLYGTSAITHYPRKKGTTAQRPTLGVVMEGFMYMDTTLAAAGRPIWWNGSAWLYHDGTAV